MTADELQEVNMGRCFCPLNCKITTVVDGKCLLSQEGNLTVQAQSVELAISHDAKNWRLVNTDPVFVRTVWCCQLDMFGSWLALTNSFI